MIWISLKYCTDLCFRYWFRDFHMNCAIIIKMYMKLCTDLQFIYLFNQRMYKNRILSCEWSFLTYSSDNWQNFLCKNEIHISIRFNVLVYHIILTFHHSLTVLITTDELSHLGTLLFPVVNVFIIKCPWNAILHCCRNIQTKGVNLFLKNSV